MKYLGQESFQVGGYSRQYADNWESIFGARAAELKAEKEKLNEDQGNSKKLESQIENK